MATRASCWRVRTRSSKKSPLLRHAQRFEEAGPRPREVTRRRTHLAHVLARDHAPLGETEGIVEVRRSPELLGRRREVADAKGEHAEPAVGIAEALEITRDPSLRHRLLEGDARLAQPAVGLKDVASARLDPSEARVLVRRPQQRRRPLHGGERTVIVASKALQQALALEAMTRQLPLAHAHRHRGAFTQQCRGVTLAPHALIQAAAAEVFGTVTAVAGREEPHQRVERGIQRGRVSAAGVGEADEGGHLRRPVVQPFAPRQWPASGASRLRGRRLGRSPRDRDRGGRARSIRPTGRRLVPGGHRTAARRARSRTSGGRSWRGRASPRDRRCRGRAPASHRGHNSSAAATSDSSLEAGAPGALWR